VRFVSPIRLVELCRPAYDVLQPSGHPTMTRRTKGQIEALISQAAVKFEREYMGRGPSDARTHLLRDMAIVRLKGILTPAEQQLIRAEGVELIKHVRTKLLESGREQMEKRIQDITGLPVISMHSDLSTKTGERVIIFVFSENIEEKFA
jgi:uncharacterized protein YbcI